MSKNVGDYYEFPMEAGGVWGCWGQVDRTEGGKDLVVDSTSCTVTEPCDRQVLREQPSVSVFKGCGNSQSIVSRHSLLRKLQEVCDPINEPTLHRVLSVLLPMP